MKKLLLVLVILVICLHCASCLDNGSNTPKPEINLSGTKTSETTVGGKVEWNVTVKNNGPGSLDPFRVHLLYDHMDLLSIDPQPLQMRVKGYPEFNPLASGQSITIKVTFIATEIGVADNSLFVDGYEEGLNMQTVIR